MDNTLAPVWGGNEAERQLRLIDWGNSGAFKAGYWGIHLWPAWVRQQFLKRDKNNKERHALYFHFVANGMPPDDAADMTLIGDMVELPTGWVYTQSSYYDRAAIRQVRIQFAQMLKNNTFFKGTRRTYDINLGKVIRPDTTNK